MIFYPEREYKGKLKSQVESLIGSEISFGRQLKKGSKGSPLFYIDSLKLNGEDFDFSSANSRGNFERYHQGLKMRINYRNEVYCLIIPDSQSTKIIITGGNENISPLLLSPMYILSILGLPIRYSRYFRLKLSEYSVDEIQLKIINNKDEICLSTTGYNNYRTLEFFKYFIKMKDI